MATGRLVPDLLFASSVLGAAGYYLWMSETTVVEAKESKLKPTLSGEHCMGFESGDVVPASKGSTPPSAAFSAAAMSAAASLAKDPNRLR